MGPLLAAVQTLGQLGNSCQLIVVTGKNKTLFEKLSRLAPGLSCEIKVLGFVDNIHELMQASDLMVGKAGAYLCRSFSRRPAYFYIDLLPGHEERNTEFLTNLGAGYRVKEKPGRTDPDLPACRNKWQGWLKKPYIWANLELLATLSNLW